MKETNMSTLNVPSTVMTSGSATGNPKNKIALAKGRGLMDWVRLGRTHKDLAGTGGRITKVTLEELSKHNKVEDAWTALNGKVYNITPYFEYHPGGVEELLRGVGIDATHLFNEVHKWVNYESLLQKCLVGPLVQSTSIFSKAKFLSTLTDKPTSSALPKLRPASNSVGLPSLTKLGFSLPPPPPITGMLIWQPKYDWFQTSKHVNIAIYTKWKDISLCHVIVVCKERELTVYCYIKQDIFMVNVELEYIIEKLIEVRVSSAVGKIDVLLKKVQTYSHWSRLGIPMSADGQLIAIKDKTINYYLFKIVAKTQITCDTYLFELSSDDVTCFGIPLGFHVFLGVPGFEIRRPYTPIVYPITESDGNEDLGIIKFLIKIYPDGLLSTKIGDLSVSDRLEIGIPRGSFSSMQNIINLGSLLLLAAGTGITPFPNLISSCLKNKIPVKLIFFNKTEQDIPWREDFENLTKSGLFTITHVLSRPTEDWQGERGYVTKDFLQQQLGTDEKFICICGPRPFNEICVNFLQELGVLDNNMHSFLG